MDNEATERAEVNALIAATQTAMAGATPARRASIKSALQAIVGPKQAKDMSPDEYAAAKAEIVKIRR